MPDQMVFPALGGVSSSEVVVRPATQMPVDFVFLPSHVTIVLSEAHRRLHGGSRDRLAELREAAAQRIREIPFSGEPEDLDVVDERAQLVEAMTVLQAQTGAWNAED